MLMTAIEVENVVVYCIVNKLRVVYCIVNKLRVVYCIVNVVVYCIVNKLRKLCICCVLYCK